MNQVRNGILIDLVVTFRARCLTEMGVISGSDRTLSLLLNYPVWLHGRLRFWCQRSILTREEAAMQFTVQ